MYISINLNILLASIFNLSVGYLDRNLKCASHLIVDAIGKAVYGLLLIQALRPDRLIAMARVFVEKTLGTAFLHSGEKELNLSAIVEDEVNLFSGMYMLNY